MPPKKVTASKTSSKPVKSKGTTTNTPAKKAESKKAEAAAAPPPMPPVTTISFKGLSKLTEEANSKDPKKWPLIIDLQGNVATFFKYRDANVLQAELPGDLSADKVRTALIGALRFGKPLVLDMASHDIREVEMVNDVQTNLLDSLLNKTLLEDERYLTLIKDEDEKEYHNSAYYATERFGFVVITTNPSPNTLIAAKMTCFQVE
ncbi:IQ motif and ankyrin repeat domain-containing protein 1-like [Haliotis rufescens]|uniref:IQ motif and ankyrin repeat domain-containing protein 1-like n=1 Tax=Haliotis rufescens TaxID=6454 RepID=UPI00201F88C9|nr:IQ motif and ankyrin repeat domain-containing protein 1-like [Haliotis rufescens]